MKEKTNVLVVGAGAIGLSVTGWIFPHNENLNLLARGESVNEIRNYGIRLNQVGQENKTFQIPVKVIESIDEIPSPDIIVITVKNYDLDRIAQTLRQQLGNNQPIIVSLQNGLENQRVLPKYFSRATFGVVCYNAWSEGIGKVTYVKRGSVIIGALRSELQPDLQRVASVFNPGLECFVTDRLQDAVHCKLAINLINALMALVGFRKRSIESEKILVHMTTRLLEEGIEVLQAAGFKEHYLGSLPSWRDIQIAVNIPESPENPLHDFIVNRIGPTSMTQDVFNGKTTTELESLNGYMLELARRVGALMPINQAIYEIAKERFCPDFKPVEESDLWEMINNRILDWSYTLKREQPRQLLSTSKAKE
ncbi:MAG TPA: 2-dehydropantoate 2-reductase [Verrucomicrobiae bacterium]|nr:2-dehydropantoate 2-reductase [Verrucomicrobiae bacterium]